MIGSAPGAQLTLMAGDGLAFDSVLPLKSIGGQVEHAFRVGNRLYIQPRGCDTVRGGRQRAGLVKYRLRGRPGFVLNNGSADWRFYTCALSSRVIIDSHARSHVGWRHSRNRTCLEGQNSTSDLELFHSTTHDENLKIQSPVIRCA